MARIGGFEIVGELGRGAMGVVFRGFDPSIGRPVAIKVILSQSFASAEENQMLRLRFAREATAAGKLSHPNIVTVYQLGEESDYQFLVMELIEGRPLDRRMTEGRPLDVAGCIAILRQMASALDYAHLRGVFHRDIKPANVLVSDDGHVKITDFGIARIASQTMTKTGMTMGTPAYMAPEQVLALQVDGKADQFSLAVVAFEILTGRKPFQAPTDHAVMFAIVSGERPVAHEINKLLSPKVSAVLQRAMAKEPSERFLTCAEFIEVLDSACAGKATPASVPDLLVKGVGTPAEGSRTIVDQRIATPRWWRDKKYVIGAGVLSAALLIAGINLFVSARREVESDLPRHTGTELQSATQAPASTEDPKRGTSGARPGAPITPEMKSGPVTPPAASTPTRTSSATPTPGTARPTPISADVTFERILSAAGEPANWLTYSGNYQGHHYSALPDINRQNVTRLKVAWKREITNRYPLQSTPLVADGVLYLSEPSPGESNACRVAALDGRTGLPLWTYNCSPLASNRVSCCGWFSAMARIVPAYANRGLAILGSTVFVGTADARLLALDARTGKLRWDTLVPNWESRLGHSIEGAPLAIRNKVIVGISNRTPGTRSFLSAYDAVTGKVAWRLYTVPAPGEPGNETWAGDNWKSGTASTSGTGSYDPDLNMLFWGTGSPSSGFNDGNPHPGDNLYSCSLLAVNADTGKLRWYRQFTPHDVHGWHSNNVPVLIDGEVRGHPRKLVLIANSNGFYYVLDRATGEFLNGSPFVNQTWARGLDSSGRPILMPTPTDGIVFPGRGGGTDWTSPSFSPQTRLLYIAAREEVALSTDGSGGPGRAFGSARAMDANGKFAWIMDARNIAGNPGSGHLISSGLLSTAGGLIFGGTNEGRFFALDAQTGKLLWTFETGDAVRANPISYSVDNKQYIAVSAQHAMFVFALDR